jgi:hypothetical protein
MTAVLAELRLQAVAQMRLRVKDDNPARQLHQRLGSVSWATTDGATTMLRILAQRP